MLLTLPPPRPRRQMQIKNGNRFRCRGDTERGCATERNRGSESERELRREKWRGFSEVKMSSVKRPHKILLFLSFFFTIRQLYNSLIILILCLYYPAPRFFRLKYPPNIFLLFCSWSRLHIFSFPLWSPQGVCCARQQQWVPLPKLPHTAFKHQRYNR